MAKPYFQGWYFKIQGVSTDGTVSTIAFIPAKHTDADGNTTASLQVITDAGAYSVSFPGYQYIEHEKPFFVRVGENFFGETGIELDTAPPYHLRCPGTASPYPRRHICDHLRCPNSASTRMCAIAPAPPARTREGISATTYGAPAPPYLAVKGCVTFRQITPIAYDIMGPFRYVPFMECRHSVFSMTHRVDGCLTVNGEKYVFDNAIGYIEGDRGRSFPKEYAWTQCNFVDDNGTPGSLMLSVADIPLARMHFTGVISVILWKGKEYRLATYLGAKATSIAGGAVTVRQGPYTLTARLVDWRPDDSADAAGAAKGAHGFTAHSLQAPVAGAMSRLIRESPACKAQYIFSRKGQTLFTLDTDNAAFEYEYGK